MFLIECLAQIFFPDSEAVLVTTAWQVYALHTSSRVENLAQALPCQLNIVSVFCVYPWQVFEGRLRPEPTCFTHINVQVRFIVMTMDKLQLTEQNLGQVFSFKIGHLHAANLWCF